MNNVRVAIIPRGKNFDGSYLKVEIINAGLYRMSDLTPTRIAQCEKLATLLASTSAELTQIAKRTIAEKGWTLIA